MKELKKFQFLLVQLRDWQVGFPAKKVWNFNSYWSN